MKHCAGLDVSVKETTICIVFFGTIRNFVRGGAVEPIKSWPV
jgi:hypothetical protein